MRGSVQIQELPNCTNEFTIGSWLVEGPFHIVWNQWFISLIHLRGEDPPPVFQFPEATHELVILSLHPEHQVTADTQPSGLHPLNPPDVVQQFVAENDADALRKIGRLLRLVEHSQLSPDQDFRWTWKKLLLGATSRRDVE